MLSGLKTLNGQLEFFNVDEFEVLAAAEHFMATNVEWDPTGAPCVVVVCVCLWAECVCVR